MKNCSKCTKDKPLTEFGIDRRSLDGRSSWCKRCRADLMINLRKKDPELARFKDREWNRKNPNLSRNRNLKKKFGLPLIEYNLMFSNQNGVCAICGKPEVVRRNDKIKLLAVDHNRNTGKIRSLLCQRHNMALGLINEDISILENMIKYIQTHNSKG